jgi:hypothetical protein
MKKLVILFITVLSFSACDDLTSLNDAPKQATASTPEGLFANAQKALASNMASTNVNLNIFRMFAQQWTETTYTDEAKYDMSTRNIPQNFWNALYRDVLRDLSESRKIVAGIDPLFIDEAVRKNQLAIIDITEIYTHSVLVTAFGDIPYSKSLDSENLQPAYDDAETVFNDLVTRLNAALASITVSAGTGHFASSDLVYGGDLDAWKLFGNSLKLKLGMTIADFNNASAKTIVESAFTGGVFSSSDDNAAFVFLSAPPNTNPVWVDLIQSGRKDFVAANTIVNVMKGQSDPRIPNYFTLDKFNGYVGGTYGVSNSFSTYSKPGAVIKDPTREHLLMDYSEVEFFLAEAVARGYSVGASTAATHYNNAITASMEYWGVGDATAQHAISATIVAGGTGYAVGDVLTLVGGVFTTATQVEVVTVSVTTGAITLAKVKTAGTYTVVPSGTLVTAGGTGTAATFSGLYVGGSADYLARPDVDYANALSGATYKEKIGKQKWLSLYNRGFEAWTEWRRLDFPVLVAPPGAYSAIPVRLTYPVQEQNLNGTNYAAAAVAVGGDAVTTKLFWDMN